MIDWDDLLDLGEWWDELPLRLWCVGQTFAAGYAAWAVGEPFGNWLFGPGCHNGVWGILVLFFGVFVISVLPVLLIGCRALYSMAHLWCLAVIGGAVYLTIEYGRAAGAELLPPEWRDLGPVLTWFIPCLVFGLPVVWWDMVRPDPWFEMDLSMPKTGRAIVVVSRAVIRRRD